MPRSVIRYLHNVDFTKGFERYHAKGSIKLTRTTPKLGRSFYTRDASWSLLIEEYSEDRNNFWFGLQSRSDEKIIPAQFQIFLSAQDKIIHNFQPSFHVFDCADNCAGSVLPKADIENFFDKEIVLHCLIDIPTSIFPDLIDRKRKLETDDDVEVEDMQKICRDHLADDIGKLCTTGDKFSDISVIVKQNEQITKSFSCHRNILASRSSVFERMFNSDVWSENSDTKGESGRSIEIKDIDEKITEFILNYIYAGRFPDESIDQESILLIIYAADKYDLKDLRIWCVCALVSNHGTWSDRIVQLEKADIHQLVQLKAFCLSYFSFDFSGLFENPVFAKGIPERFVSDIAADASKRRCDTEHRSYV